MTTTKKHQNGIENANIYIGEKLFFHVITRFQILIGNPTKHLGQASCTSCTKFTLHIDIGI